VTELPVPLGCGAAAAGDAFHLRLAAGTRGPTLAAAATADGKLLVWPAPTTAPHQVCTARPLLDNPHTHAPPQVHTR
jgi:hypothetical protein